MPLAITVSLRQIIFFVTIINCTGVSPSGKAHGFGPCIRGFESLHPSHKIY